MKEYEMRWDESRLSFSAQNTTNNYVCFLKKSCKLFNFPGVAAFFFFEGIGNDWTCPFRFDFFYFGWTLVTSSSSLDTTTTSSSACSLTGLFWIGETSFDFTFNNWRHSYHVSNKIPLQVFSGTSLCWCLQPLQNVHIFMLFHLLLRLLSCILF